MKKALRFLRLTDEHGRLSLTNILVLVALVKFALIKDVKLPDLSALILAVLAYNGKKAIDHVATQAAAKQVTADHVEALNAVSAKVTAVVERLDKQDTVGAMKAAMSGRKP